VINVKFLAKTSPDQDAALWLSLFPQWLPKIRNVRFHFDLNYRHYDWLVVYEGLPPLPGDSKINRSEKLACPRENTLIITTEPASIRIDGPRFLRQFGHVLSVKDPRIVRHPNQIFETPPLRWFYGRPLSNDDQDYIDVDTLSGTRPLKKTHEVSTVCSNKRMQHTLHSKRYDFVMELKKRLGNELHLYGRGINPISNKAEAMDAYKYHIAIENHIAPDHWTEKISDCFLAYCLPFYYGAPNISAFFPEEAVIPIDILDIGSAEETIRAAIAMDLYKTRLRAIIEARRRVLENHNLMSVIARLVAQRHVEKPSPRNAYIHGRHIFRRRHPVAGILDGIHKLKANPG